MKIYLIGYMGSGKSTIGRLLAEQMQLDYIDFDKNIEEEAGKTITQLFDEFGEDKFRQLEHEYLKRLLVKENIVISLGGGTPCFYNNIELINNSGTSIYLEMDVDSLAKRLSRAKNKRPLIRDLNDTELKYFIETNLEKRKAIYEQAKYTVQGKNFSSTYLTEAIIKLIK